MVHHILHIRRQSRWRHHHYHCHRRHRNRLNYIRLVECLRAEVNHKVEHDPVQHTRCRWIHCHCNSLNVCNHFKTTFLFYHQQIYATTYYYSLWQTINLKQVFQRNKFQRQKKHNYFNGCQKNTHYTTLYAIKLLTTADAYPIFWVYRSIKAMFAQIWIVIATASDCRRRTMTLSVVFQIAVWIIVVAWRSSVKKKWNAYRKKIYHIYECILVLISQCMAFVLSSQHSQNYRIVYVIM